MRTLGTKVRTLRTKMRTLGTKVRTLRTAKNHNILIYNQKNDLKLRKALKLF